MLTHYTLCTTKTGDICRGSDGELHIVKDTILHPVEDTAPKYLYSLDTTGFNLLSDWASARMFLLANGVSVERINHLTQMVNNNV